MPWFTAPVDGWELSSLGPSSGTPVQISGFHPQDPSGVPVPPRGLHTHLSVRPTRSALALVRSLGIRQSRSGQAEGAATGIPVPLSNRPRDSASAARPASPASLPSPPLAAAPANSWEGSAHSRAPLGKFNLAATPLGRPRPTRAR